ncbi:MAG: glycosyltransferase [Phycisphaerae bacterium]|nr:glycosyltransferase [Phycisphaerae bacterium]
MVLTLALAVVGVLWALATLQGLWSLTSGVRFYRYVRRERESLRTRREACPPAVILLPCCGVDDRLAETVAALGSQNYPDYEIIFAFESVEDPAYSAVGRWISGWQKPRCRRVVAGRANERSQKIHNLLAALSAVSADREVLAFLDSDAIPHSNWLRYLAGPLSDPTVGATTGFRWYTSNGSMAGAIRSAWNAASVTFLHDEKLNFCWGGSTAIRRETFERMRIASRWQRALSDDYQVTRAVRDAGLRIHFVPDCLIPCMDHTTLRSFLTFARRQLVITRVCAPVVWKAGLGLACNFILGATAVAMLALYAYVNDRTTLMIAALSGWGLILALAGAKSLLRQVAVRTILRPPFVSWRDFAWDVLGVGIVGVLHLALLLSSSRSRRIRWRSTEYEMISPDETIVLGRTEPAPQGAEAVVGLT